MKFTLTNDIAFGVADRVAATNYYVGKLGFELVEEHNGFTHLRSGTQDIYLCADDGNTPMFAFECDDVDAGLEFMLQNGCTQVAIPSDNERYVRDPFGFFFAISKSGQ